MKNKLLIRCDEANHVCDKSQYREASASEKIRLFIHTLYCKACRKYVAANTKLTALIKKSKLEAIEASEKYKMKVRFEEELSKQK
jgi:hypothetical protein